ncbi:MAG: 2OG-Fe(II) oxygenase [Alphaproteobacteria bacterium]|nr:2OG-Fe(II) oxygenase [Alphaproteobacteria bacterium]
MTDARLDRILNGIDAGSLAAALSARGHAVLDGVLTSLQCRKLAGSYDNADGFRSRVVMEHHGYGQGEYKYLSYPLPEIITRMRVAMYPPLAAIANDWNASLNIADRFPEDHATYLETCHRAGQTKPTPLLLRYGPGDHNRLHQDLYGDHVFPLQATILLSRPEEDFSGGEFVLTEQRPRQQSRVDVVPLSVGDCVIFPVRSRPVQGKRSVYRATMRHGVSRVRGGSRTTLGIIFHDAK